MAFKHGKDAAISVNGTLISVYTDSTGLSRDRDTAETTTFGVNDKTHIPGLMGGSLSISGNYDPTASVGQAAVLEGAFTGGVAVTCIYYPGGNSSGQRSHTFSGIVTNYSETSSVSDKVTFSSSILVTGAVTTATI